MPYRDPEQQHVFHLSAQHCSGCRTCVLACKDYRNHGIDVAFRQVYEVEGGSWAKDESGSWTTNAFAYALPVSCNHCSDPVCTKVCPTGAMHRDDYGAIRVSERRCIGCGYCALSCPYHAPKVDRSVGHSVKCDMCIDRLRKGLEPICVDACPARALELLPSGEQLPKDAVQNIPPLPDGNETHPNLWITPPAPVRDFPDRVAKEGIVINRNEIV